MNQPKKNYLIVETKDGAKYHGIYVSKDIQRQIITLSEVKKIFEEKEEGLPMVEITKDSIASINIIDIRPPKDNIHNFNEIPENKKNVVDENKLSNIEKAYDKSKDDFFDNLKSMTNPEAIKESKVYNKKNRDTFNLPENYNDNDYNLNNWRGNRRGNVRGRGGNRGNRGRNGYNNYYNNYNNNYNNNYKNNYNNYNNNYNNNNYNGYGNNKGENQNDQEIKYIRGRPNRIRGRGRGRATGNRGGYGYNKYQQNYENYQYKNNINEMNNMNNY